MKSYEEYHAVIQGVTPPHNAYDSIDELLADNQGQTAPLYIKKVSYVETIVAVYNVGASTPLPKPSNSKYNFSNDSVGRNKRVSTPAPGTPGTTTA